MNTKLKILFRCPDIKTIRKAVARIRINRLNDRMLPDDVIESAESDKEKKHSLVVKYLGKKNARFNKAKPKIKDIIQKYYSDMDQSKKKALYEDMVFCYFAYGFQPDEYLFYGLKDKSMAERKTYVSDVERNKYFMQMNDICDGEVFLNKSKTYSFYKKYYKRDAMVIDQKTPFADFENYINKHPVFVLKRVDQSKGNGIELVNISSIEMPLEQYFEKLKNTAVFQLEEKIIQSSKMSLLNESSVNTIRCNAFVTKHGVEIPFTFLKVGRAGSFVDNGGKGGILVGIDEKTGILNTDGMDESCNKYTEHPESGVHFKGFSLPDWEGALQLCRKITPKIKGIKAVGWDLAHTDNGWVIVEGNLWSQFVGPQITREHGLKKEWLSVMNDMDLLSK